MPDGGDTIAYRPYLNRDRLVYLFTPDQAVGRALGDEFSAQGFEVSTLQSLASVREQVKLRRPDLVIMPMAGSDGKMDDVLGTLTEIRGQHLGIHSFLLAPANVRAENVVQAVKHGASWVFSPPIAPVDLAKTAQDLFRPDLKVREGKEGMEAVSVKGFGTLTFRERQILKYVVDGRTNKEIAGDLGLSYRTVEVHRRHIMEKIGARNTAELVRLAIET
jgi:two-component system, LuxR family, response regulator FixJ